MHDYYYYYFMMQNYTMSSNSSLQVINRIIKMTVLHYEGSSREKRNWVKGKEMLLFNAIFVDKYTKGHTIESRLTC